MVEIRTLDVSDLRLDQLAEHGVPFVDAAARRAWGLDGPADQARHEPVDEPVDEPGTSMFANFI